MRCPGTLPGQFALVGGEGEWRGEASRVSSTYFEDG